jgi:2,4-dienoyl-CoA reductase (NADPH2)
MPAMALAYTDDYTFSQRYKAFYRERAKGGVGLMIIGPVAIDKVGSTSMPGLFDDKYIGPFGSSRTSFTKIPMLKSGSSSCRWAVSLHPLIQECPLLLPRLYQVQSPVKFPEDDEDDIEEVKEAYAQGASAPWKQDSTTLRFWRPVATSSANFCLP